MGTEYTPEHLASVAADPIPLVRRLRGDYGIRSFNTPPIQHVAADALDAKDARISQLQEAVRVLGEAFVATDEYADHDRINGVNVSCCAECGGVNPKDQHRIPGDLSADASCIMGHFTICKHGRARVAVLANPVAAKAVEP